VNECGRHDRLGIDLQLYRPETLLNIPDLGFEDAIFDARFRNAGDSDVKMTIWIEGVTSIDADSNFMPVRVGDAADRRVDHSGIDIELSRNAT
jgi:hypothetical protein